MSLSFLNSFFLYFLPLFTIPFILHLLFKKKPVRISFSHLEFLKIASKRVMPRSRINQWLLLIIRSVIILFLVFLFSRPILHIGAGSDAGEENAMAIVIVVDSSYSMRGMVNGQTIFSRARKTAMDIIEHLQPSDRAAVLLFSDELENPSPALIADKKMLIDICAEASPGYRITDAPAAFGMAFDMLSQSAVINKGIIFLTDSAAHAWKHDAEKFSRTLEKYDKQAGIIIIDCGLPADNVFIEDVGIPVVLAGDDAHCTWRIFNPTQTRMTQKEMSLMIGEKQAANRGMVLSAGKSSQGVLPFSASQSGEFPATLTISPDILMEDNLFYFYVAARSKLSVLCVDGDPEMGTVSGETYFARLALGESGASPASGVRLHVINQDQLAEADMADFQVVLLCNVDKLPGDFKKNIESFLHTGGGLGIFPGDNVRTHQHQRRTM